MPTSHACSEEDFFDRIRDRQVAYGFLLFTEARTVRTNIIVIEEIFARSGEIVPAALFTGPCLASFLDQQPEDRE
jgi:hypothetical protein